MYPSGSLIDRRFVLALHGSGGDGERFRRFTGTAASNVMLCFLCFFVPHEGLSAITVSRC
jgi:hypothetical protein